MMGAAYIASGERGNPLEFLFVMPVLATGIDVLLFSSEKKHVDTRLRRARRKKKVLRGRFSTACLATPRFSPQPPCAGFGRRAE
jgi:hypothetical protein